MNGYYVNYNAVGQEVGGNRVAPYDIKVEGVTVTFKGQMSTKSFEEINTFASHSRTDTPGTLYCVSEDAAIKVAEILEANPNYARK